MINRSSGLYSRRIIIQRDSRRINFTIKLLLIIGNPKEKQKSPDLGMVPWSHAPVYPLTGTLDHSATTTIHNLSLLIVGIENGHAL